MLRMEIFLSVSLISVGTFGHDPGWNLAGVGPQFFVFLDQSLGSVGVVPSLSTTTVDVGAVGVRGRCVCTSPCVWCRLSVAHIAGDGLFSVSARCGEERELERRTKKPSPRALFVGTGRQGGRVCSRESAPRSGSWISHVFVVDVRK